MHCPACGHPVDEDAWLCPNCDHILDPSVLGDSPVPEEGAFAEHTKMVAWEGDGGGQGSGDLPDAMILGDVTVDSGEFSLVTGVGADADGRTSTFLYYSASTPSRVVNPEAVPVLVSSKSEHPLTPYESFVRSLVDGERSVRSIRALSGLAVSEIVVTLLTLIDKGLVQIQGIEDEDPQDEVTHSSFVEPEFRPSADQHPDAALPFGSPEGTSPARQQDAGDQHQPEGLGVPSLPPLGLDGPADEDLDDDMLVAPVLQSESPGPGPAPVPSLEEFDEEEEETAMLDFAFFQPDADSEVEATVSPVIEPPPLLHRPRLPTAVGLNKAAGGSPFEAGAAIPSVPEFDADFGSLLAPQPSLEPLDVPMAATPASERAKPVEKPAPRTRPIAERDARPQAKQPVRPKSEAEKPPADPILAAKASKLFEQALADRAAGNLVSARMNTKLALTFDPSNEVYKQAFEEISSQPGSSPPKGPGRNRGKELYDAATEAENAGDYDKAIASLEKAIAASKQAAFYNRLGVLLAMRKQDYPRAQQLIEEAIERAPGNAIYTRNLHKVLSMAATHRLAAEKKKKKGGILSFLGLGRR